MDGETGENGSIWVSMASVEDGGLWAPELLFSGARLAPNGLYGDFLGSFDQKL